MPGSSCCALLLLVCVVAAPAQGVKAHSAVLHESRCGRYLLQWIGESPGNGYDPRFGAIALRIVKPGGDSRSWAPRGEVFFSDWSYEPCSPNARWLVLLQDRYGPIHAVRAENLWRYLRGGKADQILRGTEGPTAQVHSEIRWIGEQTLRYQIGGSPPLERVVRLP